MQADFNTLLALGGFLLSIVTVLIKSGQQDGKHKQLVESFERRMTELEHDRARWREKIQAETDARFQAMQALSQLLQSQIGETRERLAGEYMRKPEIAAIEARVNDKQREIVDTLNKLDQKVDTLLMRKAP